MEIKMIKTGLLQENTYVVSKDSFCLVIDPGDDLYKINDYLNSKNLKTKAVLLTHGHFDHIGVAKELSLIEKCNIYASLNEKEIIEDASKNGSSKYLKKKIEIDSVTYFDEEVILEIGDFKVAETKPSFKVSEIRKVSFSSIVIFFTRGDLACFFTSIL